MGYIIKDVNKGPFFMGFILEHDGMTCEYILIDRRTGEVCQDVDQHIWTMKNQNWPTHSYHRQCWKGDRRWVEAWQCFRTAKHAMCECEHADHFGNKEPDDLGLLPDGSEHPYGTHFSVSKLRSVKTIMGTFNICERCAADHYTEEWRVK